MKILFYKFIIIIRVVDIWISLCVALNKVFLGEFIFCLSDRKGRNERIKKEFLLNGDFYPQIPLFYPKDTQRFSILIQLYTTLNCSKDALGGERALL